VNAPDPVSLVAHDARVEIEGAIACDRLRFEVSGSRIVIGGGAVPALAAALSGRGSLTAGSITVDGHEVADGRHLGHVGTAPLDPPMPSATTAQDFVALSFRIAGSSAREARRIAVETLAALGLPQMAGRRIGSMALAEKRVLVIAQAMLPQCRVLFSEAPLAGLEPAAAAFVLKALAEASRTRAIITTALRVDPLAPERDLIAGADQVVLLSGEGLAWSGSPGELIRSRGQLLLLQIRGETEAFMNAAREASIEIEGAPPRVIARLPDAMPRHRLFELAESAQAVIIELLPVWPGSA